MEGSKEAVGKDKMEAELKYLEEQVSLLRVTDGSQEQKVEIKETRVESLLIEKQQADDQLLHELMLASFKSTTATEIAFYDIETTIPNDDIIEFGAIILDKRGLFEKESFSTLIRSSRISKKSIEANGITAEMVKDSPNFVDLASKIFSILDGRIWAGHNIISFDNQRIREQFEKIGRAPPKPTGIIDTYPLLRATFGERAGNMKMASLGHYFQLGDEKHRALDDCRMTIEVLKNCALTLFLEGNVGEFKITPKVKKSKAQSSPRTTPTSSDSFNGSASKKSNSKKKKNKTPNNDPNEHTLPVTPNSDLASPLNSSINQFENENSTPLRSKIPKKSENNSSSLLYQQLSNAISQNQTIWVSYDGGGVPRIPREISPKRWVTDGKLFTATCGTGTEEKNFAFAKLLEIRQQKWELQ